MSDVRGACVFAIYLSTCYPGACYLSNLNPITDSRHSGLATAKQRETHRSTHRAIRVREVRSEREKRTQPTSHRQTGHRHRPRRQRRRPRSPLRAPWEIVLLCHLHDLKACYLCNRTCTWAVLQVNKYIFDIANLQQYLASWSWLRGRGFVVDVL